MSPVDFGGCCECVGAVVMRFVIVSNHSEYV